MTNKKIVVIIVSVVVVLGLLAALFVGGIAWFALRTMGNSEAAETARTFLRDNEVLKRDIGEVKDFGLAWSPATSHPTAMVPPTASQGYGERKRGERDCRVIYRNGDSGG